MNKQDTPEQDLKKRLYEVATPIAALIQTGNKAPAIDVLLQTFLPWHQKQLEHETNILKADLARAMGYCQGLGKPDKYLESSYPELASDEDTPPHMHTEYSANGRGKRTNYWTKGV